MSTTVTRTAGSRMVNFRASEDEIETYRAAAKLEGLSLSAWLKRTVEEELDVSRDEDEHGNTLPDTRPLRERIAAPRTPPEPNPEVFERGKRDLGIA